MLFAALSPLSFRADNFILSLGECGQSQFDRLFVFLSSLHCNVTLLHTDCILNLRAACMLSVGALGALAGRSHQKSHQCSSYATQPSDLAADAVLRA
jgi:hypothetical protein